MEREVIDGVLEKHRAWLKGEAGGERACLRGANLICRNFQGMHFMGANLEGADLREADLRGANLRGANLTGADLRCVNLQGADLRDTYLRDACLVGADLQDTRLQGAHLNWRSHDLIVAALWPAAHGDLEREKWLRWILLRRNLCWAHFVRTIPSEVLQWGLDALAAWVHDGECVPGVLKPFVRGEGG